MPQRLPDLNEPRMKALLSHLKNPTPFRQLARTHGQRALQKITATGANDILAGQPMSKMADVYAYTLAEVRFAKAHLAVLGHA